MMKQTAFNQSGLSLVEMMVALVMGLILLIGAIQVMLASKATFRANDDSARVQENGRFAIDLLVHDVRMAGHREPGSGDLPHFFFTDACDTLDPCTANGADAENDRIAVQYDPATDTDCIDNPVGATDVVANVYQIVELDGVNSLTCRGWNASLGAWMSPARPLIDGVDALQILYGLRSGAMPGISRYVSADRVADWAQVKAVRVAFLVSSGTEQGQSDGRERNFVLLDSPVLSFDDRHSRRVYGTTVMLNNAT